MLNYLGKVYRQALVTLDSSSGAPRVPDDLPHGYGRMMQSSSSTTTVTSDIALTESLVVMTTFSTVPILWDWELSDGYRELGEALSEMTELEDEDEWRIEAPVYSAACYVASGLMENLFPPPHIFTHGPKSIIFNWSHEGDNLYLTISADHISALISSPERIKRRVEFSTSELANPSVALPSIRAAYLKKPVRRLPAETGSGLQGITEVIR